MYVKPQFEVDFKRNYGTHRIETNTDDVTIFSYPTWEDLHGALKHNLPSLTGTVLTTEQATFPEHQAGIPDSKDIIAERINQVRDLTKYSEAAVLLGTPLEEQDGSWSNSVMHIRGGMIGQIDRKIYLSGYEHQAGIISPAAVHSRNIAQGRIVLICSEVIVPHKVVPPGGTPETALISACWAVPDPYTIASERERWMKYYASTDAYYEKTISDIGRIIFRGLPSVKTIIMADRNVAGSECEGPYNAVLSRLEPS